MRKFINLKAKEILAGAAAATTVDEVLGYKAEFEVRLAKNVAKLEALASDKNPKRFTQNIKHLTANIAKLDELGGAFAKPKKPKKAKSVAVDLSVPPNPEEILAKTVANISPEVMKEFLTSAASPEAKYAFVMAMTTAK